jgi:hypothetical protein
MPEPVCSDDEFIRLIEEHGPSETARRLKIAARNVYGRRRRLEARLRRPINTPDDNALRRMEEHPQRVLWEIEDGIVLIGSDAHYWPGEITTAHRAFVYFARRYKPTGIVMNGDVFDGASISRHPPIGWEHRPKVQQEIEVCGDRLDEVLKATPRSKRAWTLGNHCARFATWLATHAPEFAKVKGTQLKDHFPGWPPCWSVWINDSIVIKHRFRNGVHASYNSTLFAGKTLIHGHTHSLKVTPITDYNGTRFGVDDGTLADPFGPQFEGYMEDNPRNWRSGFTFLTIRGGRLLWPEVVHVIGEGEVEFRGEIIRV